MHNAVKAGFRPLSWGLSFNLKSKITLYWEYDEVFSSPFLGTFFQLHCDRFIQFQSFRFRPLSWGLSFNHQQENGV